MPTVLVKDINSEKNEVSFELEMNEVIYEGLERQNYELPHGCLAGSCGACRIEIINGAENLKTPSAVESDTIQNIKENLVNNTGDKNNLTRNIRLACRARIQGNITISSVK